MEYFIWRARKSDIFCSLEDLDGIDDSFELKRGISRAEGFPKDASFNMNRKKKKSKKLSDNIGNVDGLLVVSKKLKEFIAEKEPRDVEYLPVTIMDHKKKPINEEYFIVNPYKLIQCINTDETKNIVWNAIDPELISGCTNIVLDSDKIGIDYPLFRPRHLPYLVMIQADFANEISDAGFVGPHFFSLDKFIV